LTKPFLGFPAASSQKWVGFEEAYDSGTDLEDTKNFVDCAMQWAMRNFIWQANLFLPPLLNCIYEFFGLLRFVSIRFFGFSGFYDGSTTQESTSVHWSQFESRLRKFLAGWVWVRKKSRFAWLHRPHMLPDVF